jgi:hypothetical protein
MYRGNRKVPGEDKFEQKPGVALCENAGKDLVEAKTVETGQRTMSVGSILQYSC